MRLRTFESFWLIKDGLLSSYPSLQNKHDSAQIAVIGGGITGALVSYALVEKGYDVILIDKRDIGMGSTAASTSMLQYEIDVPLVELRKLIGEEGAARCYLAGSKAIDTLEALIGENEIDCGFARKQSLYIAKNKGHSTWLREECRLRGACGLTVQWLEKEELLKRYGLNGYGAILSASAASVDAYKLTHELIQRSVKKGMRVYDQTVIAHFDLKEKQPMIKTEGGGTVLCNEVVFCTGYEATSMLREKVCRTFSTYACVSEQNIAIHEQLKNTLVWNTDEPYFYMRTTGDNRLLIGGADAEHNFLGFGKSINNRKLNQLKRQLKKIAPAVNFIDDFSWAGTFGSTKDGLPYIGRSPEYKQALFALGFGGNGIVFSIQAMQIINDLLQGKSNCLAHWYRFGR